MRRLVAPRRWHGRTLLAGASLLIAPGVLLSCTLLTPLDGIAGDPSTPDSGGPADGPPDERSSTAEASSDATVVDGSGDGSVVNLHPQGTFETGCEPWKGFQGTVAPTSLAHAGSGGCSVCTAPTTTDYFTADDVGISGAVLAGQTYRIRAWVRAAPGGPALTDVELNVRTIELTPAFRSLGGNTPKKVAVGAAWQRLEETYTVVAKGLFNVFVGSSHVTGACFVLDDVTLERL